MLRPPNEPRSAAEALGDFDARRYVATMELAALVQSSTSTRVLGSPDNPDFDLRRGRRCGGKQVAQDAPGHERYNVTSPGCMGSVRRDAPPSTTVAVAFDRFAATAARGGCRIACRPALLLFFRCVDPASGNHGDCRLPAPQRASRWRRDRRTQYSIEAVRFKRAMHSPRDPKSIRPSFASMRDENLPPGRRSHGRGRVQSSGGVPAMSAGSDVGVQTSAIQARRWRSRR